MEERIYLRPLKRAPGCSVFHYLYKMCNMQYVCFDSMLATIFLRHHNKILNNQDGIFAKLAYVTLPFPFFVVFFKHFIKHLCTLVVFPLVKINQCLLKTNLIEGCQGILDREFYCDRCELPSAHIIKTSLLKYKLKGVAILFVLLPYKQ